MQTPAVRTAAIGSSLLLLVTPAWAQSTPVQMPKVMLSVGLGAAMDHDTTSQLRSVALEVLATRNLVFEAEAMQWDMSTEREESFRYNAPNNP